MYKISLPNFEGPFDLLLYFIKRDEINIYDIPIFRITQEFLNYVRIMQIFDLDLAGEFLVMASTLMYIKTQMLLPRPKGEDSDEIEDPRNQLVQRLLEYKQFKTASMELGEKAEDEKYIHYRKFFETDNKLAEDNIKYNNANLFDLLKAFKNVLDRNDIEPPQHVVEVNPLTVSERSEQLIYMLRKKPSLSFFKVVEKDTKSTVIITFLSILDLIRTGKIFIVQDETFDDIRIALIPDLN